MSVISDIKSIVGLAAIGAIGYGTYKLYKQLPTIQADFNKGLDDLEKQLKDLSDDTTKTIDDYFKDVKNPDIVISDNPIDTVLQPNPAIGLILQPNPLIQAADNLIVEPIKDADWSDPVKTVFTASPGGQILKAFGISL